jgi:hypothetical protein
MVQADIFLNGVPYVQAINDVTNPGQSTGIHFEPGIWLMVPETTVPQEGVTVARMASIPHGTTIEAQGIAVTIAGAPDIKPVDITPTKIKDGTKVPKFPSQTAANQQTARIPQDLMPFMFHGTITQDLLDDPNSMLRNQIAGQKILSTTTLIVTTTQPRHCSAAARTISRSFSGIRRPQIRTRMPSQCRQYSGLKLWKRLSKFRSSHRDRGR